MSTQLNEEGLEALIVRDMVARGWTEGSRHDYDRDYAVDLVQLSAFLAATQPHLIEALDLDADSPTRRKFLARLQGQITAHGVVNVLRNGIKDGQHEIDLFYGTPSKGNKKATDLFAHNRFTVARQVRYSLDETQRALDLVIFINGLPIATFELKNSLTKQTAEDAIQQYKRDRNPKELLFQHGRCVAHFALDDQVVRFCTHLKGRHSWFLPFDKGWKDGAGNPPNPEGTKTAYLWQTILAPTSLTDIVENYASRIEEKNPRTNRKSHKQIFPRYHQLDVVRGLLADAAKKGVGQKYLIQHSAGSGKSNSIAWLALQLVTLERENAKVFDSIIVVTDRRILDGQIHATIKQFSQVKSILAHADSSADLRRAIEAGKKIIITTVQKFPFILDGIGDNHRDRNFAIVIDEAHSSQGGKSTGAVNTAFSPTSSEEAEEETVEDKINKIIEARRMLSNASYFAFTATPKNKTLELFCQAGPDGRRRAFHTYSMKQAIEEGFILDVLKNYMPITSFYKLMKTVEGDPEFDSKKAEKKLRQYVENHEYAIRAKAEIMVDHFHEHVIALKKIGGNARSMVVTSSIARAIEYYHAISDYLVERKSPYRAIVAFSGEHEYGGNKVTEATLNDFPSNQIAEKIQEDPYRILVCADKFQTGYDEPLLHTMYVDKALSGVKAVQTLSRLNRAHPDKRDVAVLDFFNDALTIEKAFSDHYRTTVLVESTDPNKLHDLKADLDSFGIYTPEHVESFVRLYLQDADREQLDPILDVCVAAYIEELDEDDQIEFKGKAKAFVRTYDFLSSVLSYSSVAWEKLSILLTFLVSKLPAPREEDLSRGILETIDMESYRIEKKAAMSIALPDEDGEIKPVPMAGVGYRQEPEMESLSSIIKNFNDHFGNIQWTDADRIQKLIFQEIPAMVAADEDYQRAMQGSDKQNAKIEHGHALGRVMRSLLKDHTELFKYFSNDESFKRWMTDFVFDETYKRNKSA
ncbi:type I restriction endonuclease subunit R [Microtetraspora niveoalba]|uniref:type I restriction endonuclease subunit R n=1 Tax=Microtetraspora niveoalba TaxID=46175 RepID=UPI0008336114|nr:type I restriction endonuclease subunit R [Microtetraspora niveoalba]